jgi:hypothetical protein
MADALPPGILLRPNAPHVVVAIRTVAMIEILFIYQLAPAGTGGRSALVVP